MTKWTRVLKGVVWLCVLGILSGCNANNESSEKIESSGTKESRLTREIDDRTTDTQAVSEEITSVSQAEEENDTTAMDFEQIQQGDYTSLLGDWKEIAVFFNKLDGQGSQWIAPRGDKMEISVDALENQANTLSHRGLFSENQENEVNYEIKQGYLHAASYAGTNIWIASFYPKNVELDDFGVEPPTSIDSTTDRIAVGTNHYIQIFQRTSESTSDDQNASVSLAMSLNEIKEGNYSSVNGTWKNNLGDTITVEHQTISFSNITTYGEAAEIDELHINIPSANGADGTPLVEEGIGGIQRPRYAPQLETSQVEGYVTLQTNYSDGLLCISFLPSGISGDIQEGDSSREKIVALGTQNGPTVVSNELVYYRVD